MDQVVRLHYGVEAGQNSIHHQPHQAEEGLRVKRHQAVPKSSADAMFPCDSREGGSDADQPFPERCPSHPQANVTTFSALLMPILRAGSWRALSKQPARYASARP